MFKLKLIQPSSSTIHYWSQTNNYSSLQYALKFGNYTTRRLAANALGQIGQPSSIPVLLNAINDKVQNVSIAALNSLETLDFNNELITIITRKRFNWLKTIRDKEERQKAKKSKKYNIYRWERASKNLLTGLKNN